LALFPRRRVSPRVGTPALVHPVDCWCSMGALKKKCSACKPDDPHSNHCVPPSLAVISVPADTLFQVNLVIHGRTIERRLPSGRCQPVRPTSSAPACGSCAPLSTAWSAPKHSPVLQRPASPRVRRVFCAFVSLVVADRLQVHAARFSKLPNCQGTSKNTTKAVPNGP